MGNSYKVKRNKYLSLMYLLKSFRKTRKISIKSSKTDYKRLAKYNKKESEPYVILSTYGSVIDPLIMKRNFSPRAIYNVYNIDDVYNAIRAINKAIKKKINVVIYPEKYPSLDGTTSPLSKNIITLLKKLNKNVVVSINHGTYINAPIWHSLSGRGVIKCELKMVFTKEELSKLSDDELYNKLYSNMYYDDYMWLKTDKSMLIDKPNCAGIENILYKCPSCLEENKMLPKGAKIYCISCGKQWEMTKYGDMKATLDETEYATIHDWFGFEKDCIREEIGSGTYKYANKVKIQIIDKDNRNKVINTCQGIMWHGVEGIVLKYNLGSKQEDVIINLDKLDSVLVNYNIGKKETCIEIPLSDTIIRVCQGADSITVAKLAMVNEALYKQYSDLAQNMGIVNDKSEKMAVTVAVEDLLESEEKIEHMVENAGNVIAVEYVDDDEVTASMAHKIRQSAKTAHTD